ncbi:MAG: Ig domain-containing protein [Bacilli bacterium]|nr:Ig domain-containing protein [Bacilli bacterium]
MKHKSLFLIPLAAALMLSACEKGTPVESSIPASSEPTSSTVAPKPATDVTIQEGAAASIKKGKTLTLHASVTPNDADDLTITWSSQNEAVASVSSEGVVTAIAVGEAKIVASSATPNVKAEITITVIEASISITGGDSVHMGDTLQLAAATNNAEGEVAWSSSAASIATVDDKGLVTPVSVGQATITATVDGVSATKVINVLNWILDDAKFKAPESYALEVTHTHLEDVVTDGSEASPRHFHPSEAANNGALIASADIKSKSVFYRFSIVTAGLYRIYSHCASGDTKIDALYKYDDQGVRGGSLYQGFANNDDYVSSTYPDASSYCGNNRDFYIEVSLEAGDYLAQLTGFSSAGDTEFHIELKDAQAPVYADGPADQVEVSDVYSLTRVANVGYLSSFLKNGVVLENGKAYPFAYDARDNEYVKKNEELASFSFGDTSLNALTAVGAATFVKSENGKNYFDVASDDGFGKFLIDALGMKMDIAKLTATSSMQSGAFEGLNFVLADGDELEASVASVNAFPVSVKGYSLDNGGEFNGEGGSNQDW